MRLGDQPLVLVVDDEPQIQKIVADHLPGYRCLPAYNGWQACTALATQPVDVAILDLELPDTNGVALLPELLALRPELVVLALTSCDGPRIERAFPDAGAFAFFTKSFEVFEQLPQQVARAFAFRDQRRRPQVAAG